ncbi:MAG: YigZ family protein [Nonlabens sp.]|nr:YigZ family protein [Nonlabens sp.]
MKDSYNTIKRKTAQVLFKDAGSKFYGSAFPLQNEEQVATFIEPLRKKYKKANHHCYAWKLGNTDDNYRANDDGEPNHSAGDPILGQILARDLSDVLVVVTRIFGGTKLGMGGLINAYRETARLTLEQAIVIEKTVTEPLTVHFGYEQMSAVMRLIKELDLEIATQELLASCSITLNVKLHDMENVQRAFEKIYPVTVTINKPS